MPDDGLVKFLVNGSRSTLKNAALARMAAARNLDKQIDDLRRQWIEEAWRAELFLWMSEHGAEVVEELRGGPNIFALPKTRSHNPSRWRRKLTKLR